MNSNNLKKTYFHTYEKFFIENSVVVSTPFVMNWSGDVLNNYSGISLKQQVPLRLYMGYSKTSTGTISINKINYFDFYEYKFIETNVFEYAPYFNDINNFLQKKYAKLAEKYGGIEINILSEMPRGVGLGFGSILALLMSVLMNRLEDKIDSSLLWRISNSNINDQLADQYSDFYSIFLDALEFDRHIYGMVSSGTKLASFFKSYYPIVSFSEDYDKIAHQESFDTKRYFGFRMNDLYSSLRDFPFSPVDYGIVYSGKPVLLEQIAGDNYKNNGLIAKKIVSETKNLFGDFLQNLAPKKRPKFYKDLIDTEKDEFSSTYGKMMGIISLKMLHFMAKVYHSGYDENSVLDLIETVKKLRQSDAATRNSSETFLSFIKFILEKFDAPSRYLALTPNDTSIMGGSLLFMLPFEGFRKPIMDAIDNVSKDFLGTKLLYANWLDGLGYEGCKIEQDIEKLIYSEFLDGRNCIIKWTNGKMAVGDCDLLLKNQKKGLLLDTLNNKIYLEGVKLTSQDLHSQSATIEVLKLLLQNPNKDISNKDLPVSSYSKNKNDMLGKIVIPLLSLVEKKTKKKLPLVCKGSLYDFTMRLNDSDIEMTILNPLSAK